MPIFPFNDKHVHIHNNMHAMAMRAEAAPRCSTYILAVPHHPHDERASLAAFTLASALRARGRAVIGPLLNGAPPAQVGSLAPERSREWRADVGRVVGGIERPVVVDVHSFGRMTGWEIDAVAAGRPRPLLAVAAETPTIARRLVSHLPTELAPRTVIAGLSPSDVVVAAFGRGARGAFVSFDEESAARPEWLADAADGVAAALLATWPPTPAESGWTV